MALKESMKIALDISPLSSGHKVRGVGFYVKYLMEALVKHDSLHEYQFFNTISEVKSADIIHIPYFDPFFRHLPILKKAPTVITIHDLTPIKFPSQFPVGMKGSALWQVNKRLALLSSAIITDSNSSTNDVIELMGARRERVHTVYLAPGDQYSSRATSSLQIKDLIKKYRLPKDFVLYVGDVTWNKNLPRIVEAVIKARIPLVLVGKAIANTDFDRSHPWNADLLAVQKLIHGNNDLYVLGFVPDDELKALYAHAKAVLLPSLYEGFGLPVVEAMASGCPVITSKMGSLSEVAGNAAYFVDPYSIEAIADGIKDVFQSKSLQAQLRKSGHIQVEKFSWKKTALATIDVYEKVIMGKSL